MEYEGRRRRKNNIVITEWRNEGKSKQQIKDNKENFIIKEKIEETKVKDCYNINKDQVLVEMEEWSRKEKVMEKRENCEKRRKQRRYS
jgi:hypothetical protein